MSDLTSKNSSGHVIPWLGAYLDGETTPDRRTEIEEHLAACASCQLELAQLRELSALLQSDLMPAIPTGRAAFTRQVLERITHPEPPLWQRIFHASWRFAPLALFAAWAFFQAVDWVVDLVAVGSGLFPGFRDVLGSLAPSGSLVSGWLWGDLLQMSLRPIQSSEIFAQAGWLEPLGLLVLVNLAVVTVLAGLFLGWLASWFAYQRSRSGSE